MQHQDIPILIAAALGTRREAIEADAELIRHKAVGAPPDSGAFSDLDAYLEHLERSSLYFERERKLEVAAEETARNMKRAAYELTTALQVPPGAWVRIQMPSGRYLVAHDPADEDLDPRVYEEDGPSDYVIELAIREHRDRGHHY